MSSVLAKEGCKIRNVEQHERGIRESFSSRGILKLISQCVMFFLLRRLFHLARCERRRYG